MIDLDEELKMIDASREHFAENFCKGCSKPKTKCANGCVYGTAIKSLLFTRIFISRQKEERDNTHNE